VSSLLGELVRRLAPAGLNLFGVVGRERYDAVSPERQRIEQIWSQARAVVVVGSGGRAHWDAFMSWVAADPRGRLARRAHPLDDFCAESFAALAPLLEGCRVVFPTLQAEVFLDFMRLGALAGLGAPSELGILVSPSFGPWMALRAAVFTPEALPENAPAPRSCDGCEAPCRAVCPPGIAPPALHPPSRQACPVGRAELYEELERTYHHQRALGRLLLCERFGVEDEVFR
jgi:epoxyqueuosine reductase QueG